MNLKGLQFQNRGYEKKKKKKRGVRTLHRMYPTSLMIAIRWLNNEMPSNDSGQGRKTCSIRESGQRVSDE